MELLRKYKENKRKRGKAIVGSFKEHVLFISVRV